MKKIWAVLFIFSLLAFGLSACGKVSAPKPYEGSGYPHGYPHN